ncbi:hypothetical protein M7I_3084 [Glarea lozoyensis 74030]|uniref:Uncharacterized protein n=1 Tax=Glarea lozoyensis (strain ATCC 74030 / MF5533) TaxID=1104152 RepID=H0EKI6_GLAL7|nr:hypothetical protein M7I_3084 [Glarea lozoyensis 74030]
MEKKTVMCLGITLNFFTIDMIAGDEAQRNREMGDRVDRREEQRREQQIRDEENARRIEEERQQRAQDRAEAARRERELDDAYARSEERGRYQQDMSSASQSAGWVSKGKRAHRHKKY